MKEKKRLKAAEERIKKEKALAEKLRQRKALAEVRRRGELFFAFCKFYFSQFVDGNFERVLIIEFIFK